MNFVLNLCTIYFKHFRCVCPANFWIGGICGKLPLPVSLVCNAPFSLTNSGSHPNFCHPDTYVCTYSTADDKSTLNVFDSICFRQLVSSPFFFLSTAMTCNCPFFHLDGIGSYSMGAAVMGGLGCVDDVDSLSLRCLHAVIYDNCWKI